MSSSLVQPAWERKTQKLRYLPNIPNSVQNLTPLPCSLSQTRVASPTQVVLINAVKDVAKALGDLISATKAAAGKVGDDPAVWQLKNSAKVGGSEEQQEEW